MGRAALVDTRQAGDLLLGRRQWKTAPRPLRMNRGVVCISRPAEPLRVAWCVAASPVGPFACTAGYPCCFYK